MNRSFLNVGLALLACVMAVTSQARAQQSTFKIDPEKTTVSFTLGASFHTVHGTFRLKSGAIRFDPSTGAAGGQVVVDAASGDTGNKKRDRTMHRDVLQSERYPEITFTASRVSGKVVPTGESNVRVEGVLRLQETKHPVTLEFTLRTSENELRATSHFVVPYVAWGLKNPGNVFLHVADKVDVSLVASGRLTFDQATTERR
jgi:polyisoprenoid-binding protein YceI